MQNHWSKCKLPDNRLHKQTRSIEIPSQCLFRVFQIAKHISKRKLSEGIRSVDRSMLAVLKSLFCIVRKCINLLKKYMRTTNVQDALSDTLADPGFKTFFKV